MSDLLQKDAVLDQACMDFGLSKVLDTHPSDLGSEYDNCYNIQ